MLAFSTYPWHILAVPKKKSTPQRERPGVQFNTRWSFEEDAAAKAIAKAYGLTVTDLVRMSVAAKCMELREHFEKLDQPALQIPMVRASMEGTLAVHMHDELRRIAAAATKKKN